MEGEIFSLLSGNSTLYNLTKEKWKSIKGLAEDRSIVIKPADKGSCVVVWDKLDYLAEAENHIKCSNTYQDVKFRDNDLAKLVEKSNQMFKQLLSKQNISYSEFKHLSHSYKKSTNLVKMYLLPKICKQLFQVVQSFLNLVHLPEKFLNFWIIILNLLCNWLNRTKGYQQFFKKTERSW